MYSILKKKPNHRQSVHKTRTDQNERIFSQATTQRRIPCGGLDIGGTDARKSGWIELWTIRDSKPT
ncbi:MAG TPA: hypothetical protein VG168_07205 [Bryobacteraceae bacterium]|nr:hypothetical protein [Bryobacteraceae bacterium]